MRMVMDDNTGEVHLLGMDWCHIAMIQDQLVAMIQDQLVKKAGTIADAEVREKCDEIIETIDGGYECFINSKLAV